MRLYIVSQSFAVMAMSVSFPFYLLFIKNIGTSFSTFGFAYGLFMISSACFHKFIGGIIERYGSKLLLIVYSFGMAILFLFIPWISSIEQVYVFQILLGLFGAVQKTSEKCFISDITNKEKRGKMIGDYHFWTSLFSAFAIIGTGFLLDYVTIMAIFYICSLFFFISGIVLYFYQHNEAIH